MRLRNWCLLAILAGLATMLLPIAAMGEPAQATTAYPLTSTQQAAVKAFLKTKMPAATDDQLNQLVANPDYLTNIGKVTSITVTPLPGTVTTTNLVTTSSTLYCKYAWSKVTARGLFGTLFSFKVQLDWCYNYHRVYSPSYQFWPDVTTYGSTLGWAYKGQWRSKNTHYYLLAGRAYGGYIAELFGEFSRCLGGNVGCIDQRFADVGVRGHYDGSQTYISSLN